MPRVMNKTDACLIPKVTAPKLISKYRPIAICNISYKIIAKILSLRLKPLLHLIISESQSAFVPGRAISNNVLITHELLHSLKRSEARIHCSMAVKTDMSKAYDRLEWSFIRRVLERFGFDSIWIDWVLQCISSVSYSFLINESVHGQVATTRGIRQGDPLSPYIFILCGEVLSGLCKKSQRSGHMAGIRAGRHSPRINHLLFADDTIFFLKTDPGSVESLVNTLHKYETASGQMINANKSSISFSSKTPQKTRSRVINHLGISRREAWGSTLVYPNISEEERKTSSRVLWIVLDRRHAASLQDTSLVPESSQCSNMSSPLSQPMQ